MNVVQWIASTIAVLTLIVLMGRAAKWMLARGAFETASAMQLAQWRVAPDTVVRAVRVLDCVHLVLESRKHSSQLRTLSVDEFEELRSQFVETSPKGIFDILPKRFSPDTRAVSAH